MADLLFANVVKRSLPDTAWSQVSFGSVSRNTVSAVATSAPAMRLSLLHSTDGFKSHTQSNLILDTSESDWLSAAVPSIREYGGGICTYPSGRPEVLLLGIDDVVVFGSEMD